MVIVNDTNLDSASEAGVFDVLSGGVAHGFTIGGVIRHVTTGDKGDISEAAGIGEGHGDTLIIGLFQGGHGDSGAEGGNGNTVHTLGYVGVDEFGFLGLVIAGVADDDLFDTEFLAGIFETLYHGFHELVILEDDTRDDDVFNIHRFDNYGSASGTGGGSGGSRFSSHGFGRFGRFNWGGSNCGSAGTYDHRGDHQNARNS